MTNISLRRGSELTEDEGEGSEPALVALEALIFSCRFSLESKRALLHGAVRPERKRKLY
jgi:hypothetical protein